jgi:3-phosphoshikimate 1-carboxyvinyltransferase
MVSVNPRISRNDNKLSVHSSSIDTASMYGWHDRRIVMALTVAGMVAGDTEIDTAESVAVSYPGFFEDMERLGAGITPERT